jgi:hypothetical protein
MEPVERIEDSLAAMLAVVATYDDELGRGVGCHALSSTCGSIDGDRVVGSPRCTDRRVRRRTTWKASTVCRSWFLVESIQVVLDAADQLLQPRDFGVRRCRLVASPVVEFGCGTDAFPVA